MMMLTPSILTQEAICRFYLVVQQQLEVEGDPVAALLIRDADGTMGVWEHYVPPATAPKIQYFLREGFALKRQGWDPAEAVLVGASQAVLAQALPPVFPYRPGSHPGQQQAPWPTAAI